MNTKSPAQENFTSSMNSQFGVKARLKEFRDKFQLLIIEKKFNMKLSGVAHVSDGFHSSYNASCIVLADRGPIPDPQDSVDVISDVKKIFQENPLPGYKLSRIVYIQFESTLIPDGTRWQVNYLSE